jgi:hypothetical protein
MNHLASHKEAVEELKAQVAIDEVDRELLLHNVLSCLHFL